MAVAPLPNLEAIRARNVHVGLSERPTNTSLWNLRQLSHGRRPMGLRAKTVIVVPCDNEVKRLDCGAFERALVEEPLLEFRQ